MYFHQSLLSHHCRLLVIDTFCSLSFWLCVTVKCDNLNVCLSYSSFAFVIAIVRYFQLSHVMFIGGS